VRIVCTVPYDTLTIAAISLIVIRLSSCTSHRIVSTFLGVELVEGHPDLSSSSSDVLPPLKRSCQLKHAARHMASLPYACRNMSKVSAPDLPSLTQNLMFVRCSIFKSMLTSKRDCTGGDKNSCCATPNVHTAKPIGTMSGDIASSQSQQKTFT
jgi:hypothetical protein